MELSQELFSALLQTLVGVAITLLGYFSKQLYNLFVTRNVRQFWKSFATQKLTIIVTEYPITGSDRLSKIAKVAGAGWLISKGMALSLAHLLDFCEGKVTKRKDITICGDRTGKLETSNMIVLGSPANNLYAKSMFDKLSKMYDIPYQIMWQDNGTSIEVLTVQGDKFSPDIENGFGHDYALVIKGQYQTVPPKSLIMISGCYMWGTKAGAEAVTDPEILNEVARETSGAENVAFIVKTRVINDSPIGPEIDIDNRQFIQVLKPKKNTSK